MTASPPVPPSPHPQNLIVQRFEFIDRPVSFLQCCLRPGSWTRAAQRLRCDRPSLHAATPNNTQEFPIEQHLDEAVDWIEQAVENGGRVVVFWSVPELIAPRSAIRSAHPFVRPRTCPLRSSAGQSRSASLVLAFLMRNQNLTFDEAFTMLRTKRPVVDPNPGFVKQLQHWELKALGYAGADAATGLGEPPVGGDEEQEGKEAEEEEKEEE